MGRSCRAMDEDEFMQMDCDSEDDPVTSLRNRLRHSQFPPKSRTRPVSFPPAFTTPTSTLFGFRKQKLLDRTPQAIRTSRDAERTAVIERSRKVKFADEAGKDLASYFEIPETKILSDLGSLLDNAIGEIEAEYEEKFGSRIPDVVPHIETIVPRKTIFDYLRGKEETVLRHSRRRAHSCSPDRSSSRTFEPRASRPFSPLARPTYKTKTFSLDKENIPERPSRGILKRTKPQRPKQKVETGDILSLSHTSRRYTLPPKPTLHKYTYEECTESAVNKTQNYGENFDTIGTSYAQHLPAIGTPGVYSNKSAEQTAAFSSARGESREKSEEVYSVNTAGSSALATATDPKHPGSEKYPRMDDSLVFTYTPLADGNPASNLVSRSTLFDKHVPISENTRFEKGAWFTNEKQQLLSDIPPYAQHKAIKWNQEATRQSSKIDYENCTENVSPLYLRQSKNDNSLRSEGRLYEPLPKMSKNLPKSYLPGESMFSETGLYKNEKQLNKQPNLYSTASSKIRRLHHIDRNRHKPVLYGQDSFEENWGDNQAFADLRSSTESLNSLENINFNISQSKQPLYSRDDGDIVNQSSQRTKSFRCASPKTELRQYRIIEKTVTIEETTYSPSMSPRISPTLPNKTFKYCSKTLPQHAIETLRDDVISSRSNSPDVAALSDSDKMTIKRFPRARTRPEYSENCAKIMDTSEIYRSHRNTVSSCDNVNQDIVNADSRRCDVTNATSDNYSDVSFEMSLNLFENTYEDMVAPTSSASAPDLEVTSRKDISKRDSGNLLSPEASHVNLDSATGAHKPNFHGINNEFSNSEFRHKLAVNSCSIDNNTVLNNNNHTDEQQLSLRADDAVLRTDEQQLSLRADDAVLRTDEQQLSLRADDAVLRTDEQQLSLRADNAVLRTEEQQLSLRADDAALRTEEQQLSLLADNAVLRTDEQQLSLRADNTVLCTDEQQLSLRADNTVLCTDSVVHGCIALDQSVVKDNTEQVQTNQSIKENGNCANSQHYTTTHMYHATQPAQQTSINNQLLINKSNHKNTLLLLSEKVDASTDKKLMTSQNEVGQISDANNPQLNSQSAEVQDAISANLSCDQNGDKLSSHERVTGEICNGNDVITAQICQEMRIESDTSVPQIGSSQSSMRQTALNKSHSECQRDSITNRNQSINHDSIIQSGGDQIIESNDQNLNLHTARFENEIPSETALSFEYHFCIDKSSVSSSPTVFNVSVDETRDVSTPEETFQLSSAPEEYYSLVPRSPSLMTDSINSDDCSELTCILPEVISLDALQRGSQNITQMSVEESCTIGNSETDVNKNCMGQNEHDVTNIKFNVNDHRKGDSETPGHASTRTSNITEDINSNTEYTTNETKSGSQAHTIETNDFEIDSNSNVVETDLDEDFHVTETDLETCKTEGGYRGNLDEVSDGDNISIAEYTRYASHESGLDRCGLDPDECNFRNPHSVSETLDPGENDRDNRSPDLDHAATSLTLKNNRRIEPLDLSYDDLNQDCDWPVQNDESPCDSSDSCHGSDSDEDEILSISIDSGSEQELSDSDVEQHDVTAQTKQPLLQKHHSKHRRSLSSDDVSKLRNHSNTFASSSLTSVTKLSDMNSSVDIYSLEASKRLGEEPNLSRTVSEHFEAVCDRIATSEESIVTDEVHIDYETKEYGGVRSRISSIGTNSDSDSEMKSCCPWLSPTRSTNSGDEMPRDVKSNFRTMRTFVANPSLEKDDSLRSKKGKKCCANYQGYSNPVVDTDSLDGTCQSTSCVASDCQSRGSRDLEISQSKCDKGQPDLQYYDV